MNFFKTFFLTLLVSFFISSPAKSQREINYQTLSNRASQQHNIFLDFFTLPGEVGDKVKFVTTFRINYNFLPFKKLSVPRGEFEFYSHTGLSIEVFRAKSNKKDKKDISIQGLESITSKFWKDTVYAKTYQETQSNNHFISGSVTVDLKPGLYNYLLQVFRGEENKQENSRTRQVKINSYSDKKRGSVILAEKVRTQKDKVSIDLLNYGNYALYGKEFYAFIHLPEYTSDASYTLTYNRVDTQGSDTTSLDKTYETVLSENDIYTGIKPQLASNKNSTTLKLLEDKGGYAYALVKIPNQKFPNAVYQLKLNKEGQSQPVAQTLVRSLWLGMPASLLNLEVAIEMLKYITDKETYNKLNTGSRREREKKFREFWKSKDPTPKTEFNELMTEYYKRVDYVNKNFSTQNVAGHNTDRGKIYLQYGPPENIERKFPAGEPTVEIWSYSSQKFIFKATTGFGDFKLINR